MKNKDKENYIAREIGFLLANIQSLLDDASSFLFKELKSFGETENKKGEPKKNKKERKSFLLNIIRGGAFFIGEIGNSFYENYQKLKSKKK